MTKNRLFLTLIVLLLPYCSQSQVGIQWQKCYGGPGGEGANSIQQTFDGGSIMLGSTNANGGDVSGYHNGPNQTSDTWVIKLDTAGNIQWQKCLGGSDSDYGYSICQTVDSGFIISIETHSNDGDVSGNHGESDAWIVKLSSSGIFQWQRCLGGSGYETPFSIQQSFDGGYIVAGWTSSLDGDVTFNHGQKDAWIVKLSNAGAIQWQKSLGGSGDEILHSIRQTLDSGYIAAGHTRSNDGDVSGNHGVGQQPDAWVVKLDNLGNIQWQSCLGGSEYEQAYSIQQTSDSGYIVAGVAHSIDGDVVGNHGIGDSWVVKLNGAGLIQWQECLGGTLAEYFYSIQQTLDGGFIAAGRTISNDGDVSGNHGGTPPTESWVVKMNSFGIIEWQKCLGGLNEEQANFICQLQDGGYLVASGTNSNDGDVSGNHGGYDAWIVKLYPLVGIDELTSLTNFNLYPVPSDNLLNIEFSLSESEELKLEIRNILGESLLKPLNLKNQFGWNIIQLPISNVPDGIYLVTLSTRTGSITKKFVVRTSN